VGEHMFIITKVLGSILVGRRKKNGKEKGRIYLSIVSKSYQETLKKGT
jgi:hypothetical protein